MHESVVRIFDEKQEERTDIQAEMEASAALAEKGKEDRAEILAELKALRAEVAELKVAGEKR